MAGSFGRDCPETAYLRDFDDADSKAWVLDSLDQSAFHLLKSNQPKPLCSVTRGRKKLHQPVHW